MFAGSRVAASRRSRPRASSFELRASSGTEVNPSSLSLPPPSALVTSAYHLRPSMPRASASSFLFYGVFITLPSLLIAASAHAKLSSPLLALGIISLRTDTSDLAIGSECGAINRMTSELWSLVRAQLEDIAWIEAEHELVLSVRVNSPYCHVECADYAM